MADRTRTVALRILIGNGIVLSAGMCQTCYAENWDEAFSSQAEYSDEMFDSDDD